jgi:hypothetical protein
MSFRKPFAAGAALLLFASIGGTHAVAAGTEDASIAICKAGANKTLLHVGHPGKSALFPRRTVSSTPSCPSAGSQALMLVSFLEAPGGTALMAGKSDRAIREIARDRDADSAVALSNLCVAHTTLRQWAEARTSCDAAVAAAEEQKVAGSRWPGERRRWVTEAAAAVYSNRAVMNWLSVDVPAAQGDFARARALAPKATFVVRNADLAVRLPARVEYASMPTG